MSCFAFGSGWHLVVALVLIPCLLGMLLAMHTVQLRSLRCHAVEGLCSSFRAGGTSVCWHDKQHQALVYRRAGWLGALVSVCLGHAVGSKPTCWLWCVLSRSQCGGSDGSQDVWVQARGPVAAEWHIKWAVTVPFWTGTMQCRGKPCRDCKQAATNWQVAALLRHNKCSASIDAVQCSV
jgi:hypothetical protein